ncbi:lytic transglycosylase domain-containing protein [Bradyrhizobium sp. 2TAF24]|uniref:lytic transglycosylase domain-containing protein n=1 Tax=Bradyrhizobium sp. 2TAF24 TaxID=3233011 RepID=UPI003F901FA6
MRSGAGMVHAIVGLGFALLGSPALAQTSEAPFAARFAAVEPAEQERAPAEQAAEPPKNVRDSVTKPETPPQRPADPRAYYRTLIEKETARTGLAPEIAEAVMAVESGYNPAVIGGVGEIGLMQLLPSTARMLGFSGTLADLAVPETNIHFGVMYLSQAWRLAGGDLCTAAMKYRAGHGETRFSHLSVAYCIAVRGKLMARGYPVSGAVPVATFGDPVRGHFGSGGGGCGRKCLAGAQIGRVDLAALNTRLNAIVIQVHGGMPARRGP